jgi:protein TonB
MILILVKVVGRSKGMFLDSRGLFSLRLGAMAPWLVVSLTVHAIGVALIGQTRPGLERREPLLFPLRLIGKPGGGGSQENTSAPAAVSPVAAVPATPPARAEQPARARRSKPQKTATRPRPKPPQPERAMARARPEAPEGDGGGGGSDAKSVDGFGPGSGGGLGGGEGQGGGGPVAYARNPSPPYPLVARRRGEEGVVLLDVLVGADGSASEVTVRRSSGHPLLDTAARETVERRWRFQPAVERGIPVARRVAVPIRFRLEEQG